MNRTIAVVVMAVMLAGCSNPPQVSSEEKYSTTAAVPPVVETRAVTLLRAECAKRKLNWSVECSGVSISFGQGYKYHAIAWASDRDSPNLGFIEKGGEDYWYSFGATQEIAASALIAELKSEANHKAPHEAKYDDGPHFKCDEPPVGSKVKSSDCCKAEGR